MRLAVLESLWTCGLLFNRDLLARSEHVVLPVRTQMQRGHQIKFDKLFVVFWRDLSRNLCHVQDLAVPEPHPEANQDGTASQC